MKRWSLARHAALWFGGLLLTLLLTLVGCSYLMLSSYMSSQLDDEVRELSLAASSQLVGRSQEEAKSLLEVLVKEGHDLGIGFILRRNGTDVLAGREGLALGRPEDVDPRTWRRGSMELPDGSTLIVGIDGARRAQDLTRLPGSMAALAVVFAAIAALAGWLFGRRMSRLLAEVAQSVDPTGSLTPRGAPQELSALVDSINSGFTRAEELQSRSKLLISGAAHGLRSPIQALLSQAQATLRKERDVDRYRATLKDQEQELIEFGRSVDNLVALCVESRPSTALESFDLMQELRLRLNPDRDRARRKGVAMRLSGPDSLLVEAERESLVLAIRNLVSNALSVSREEQTVQVRVASQDGLVRIAVEDDGPGIPKEDREVVFEPMRRSSALGQEQHGRVRYGLGLALVRRAMDDHGGRAWIEASPSGGVLAKLEFRVVREEAPRAASESST